MPSGGQMANPASILEDLDSYLTRVSEEEEEESEEGETTNEEVNLGDVCAECRANACPLMGAITSGHKYCLKEMLGMREELDLSTVRSENGATLAHIAARKGDHETLQMLVEAQPSLCEIGDVRGATPLHVCAYHGHLDCLSCLLTKGAQADQKDSDGATPIHFASASGHLDCLIELTNRGKGNPNEQTQSGETPVYFAAQEGHLECVHWLVEHANADPQLASNDGMTPLHAAAQTGRLNITHWMVRSAKCPITCRTCDGATPVHFAAAKGHVAILEWMLHHSLATGLEQDDFGATPVHDAAEQGQLECLYVFYNHSVDLNQQDCDGFTPKDLAEEREHKKCITFLQNPEKAFMEQKRTHARTKDMNETELGLLITQKDPYTSKTKPKKRTFSFLSKIKGGSSHGRVK